MRRCGLDLSGSRQEQVESSCEIGIEPLVSIKCWEVIEWPTVGLSSSSQLHRVS
jgi:hypothetical protein